MNKILIENETEDKNLNLEQDTIVIIKNSSSVIKYFPKKEIQIFTLIINSNIKSSYEISLDSNINVFSIDSTIKTNIEINKDNLLLKYGYSTINENDNNYEININHLGNSITSSIKNHGINKNNNKLSFVINTIVPKTSKNINTNQDSKIIVLKDNTATIKPNLLIDNDDIEANHSAYIGKFKEEEIFYLMTRGLEKKDSINLLVKSFLIGNMNISFREKEIILETIKKYWR